MINLFQTGHFKLSQFKIECDGPTQEDIENFALLISQELKFKDVIGVPTGGSMERYKIKTNH